MKICMVAPHLTYPTILGGIIHQTELSKALVKRGHEVHLITQKIGPFREVATTNLFLHEVDIPDLPSWFRLGFVGMPFLIYLIGLCRRERFDLIHDRGYLFGGVGTLVASLLKVPVVFQVDANWVDDGYLHVMHGPLVQRLLFGRVGLPVARLWLKRVILPRATVVVTVSQSLARIIHQEWETPKTKIFVVPNATDIERFHPSVDGSWVLESLGLRGKKVVTFVGAIAPWHGVDLLIESLRLISSKEGDACLLLVGGVHPGYLKKLKSSVKSAGLADRVILIGVRPHDEIPSIISASDVVVAPYVPSEKSGFSPLKIFEYMAMGKPIVATRVPYIEEILQDEVDALLVDFSSPEEMAEAVLRILKDKALSGRLGASARKKASASFAWEKTAEKLITIYSRLLNA